MKLRTNLLLSIISISLVLYLTGLYLIFSFQSDIFLDYFKEGIDLVVEYESDVDDSEVTQVISYLDTAHFAKKETIRHLNKEEAAADMQSIFGNDVFIKDMDIPVSQITLFRIHSEDYNTKNLRDIKDKLQAMPGVETTLYQEGIFDSLASNFRKLSYGVIIAGILLLLISLALISSTLKLNLYNDRKLIKTMDLVGARHSFIRRPFILQSLRNGIISGILAGGLLFGTLYLLTQYFPPISEILYSTESYYIYGGVILAGILVNITITRFLLSSYLRMRIEDIY